MRVHELVMHVAVGWGEADDGSPLKGHDVGRYVGYLISGRNQELAGETIHLESPEQMVGVP